MRSFYLRLALLATVLLLGTTTIQATHVSGGQITYTYVSPGTYTVTLDLFRDCSGINMPTTGHQIRVVNKCGQRYGNVPTGQRFTLTYQGQVEVSQTCPSAITRCQSATSTTRGIQKHTWTTTVTLPTGTNACGDGYFFAFVEQNRDNGITNLNNSNSQSFYLHAFIDTANVDTNNSATFNSDPTPYVCTGQAVNYSFGASDPDGDSLVFEFASAQRLNPNQPNNTNATNTSVIYNTPTYDWYEPIVGVTISSTTGDVSFTSNTTGKYTVRVDVLEYKSGASTPHARTPRDFQVYVDNCPLNSVPVIAAGGVLNVTGGNRVDSTTVVTKAGASLCYEVQFTDANAADTVTVTTNAASVLPGTVVDSSLNVNPANGKVCWTVPTNNTSDFNVSFYAKDDNCPINGQVSMTTTIQMADPLVVVLPTTTKETCPGTNDGTITAVYAGGVGPFGFLWDSAGVRITANTQTITNIPTGVFYEVTVVDSFDLTSVKSAGVNISPTLPITIPANKVVVTPIGCDGGCTGEVDIQAVTGGNNTTGYKFLWSPSGDTTNNPDTLCPGSHFVTISDDNNCDTVYSFTINQSPSIEVNIIDSVMVSCKGGSDGSATSTASITSCGVYSTTSTQCSSTSNAAIGSNTGSNAFNTFPAPIGQFQNSKQQYLYLASELIGQGFSKGRIGKIAFETASQPIFSGLTNYAISIGCTDSTDLDSGFVSGLFEVYSAANHVFNPFVSTITFDFTQEFEWDGKSNIVVQVCYDQVTTGFPSNASTEMTALSYNATAMFNSSTENACIQDSATAISSNRPDITFMYCDPGIIYSWNTVPTQTDSAATGLNANTYIVTASNFAGCDDKDTVVITEPLVGLTLTIDTLVEVTCNGGTNGSAAVIVTGGTPGFTFAWPTGVTTSSDSIATNLSGGVKYVVTVTDAKGCTDTVSVTLADPDPLTFTGTTKVDVACNGDSTGSISLVPNGGSGTYTTFAWNPNVSTTANATNLWAGAFNVTVTDNQGCTGDTSITITEPANGITFGGSSQVNVLCQGDSTGSITVVPAGGTGTYTTFSWNPNVSTTANATNLWAGNFSVTVTDNAGCSNDTTFTITEPSNGITFGGSSQTNITCKGDSTGTITVVPAGGTGTYTTFNWNPNVSTTANASNLWAGSFSVTVTDNAGCSNDTTFTITEPATGITFGGSSQTNITCNGDSTGTITVVPAGGTGTYTSFAWNPNVSTTANATNLWAGNFSVTVTDNAGCTNDTTFTITEPASGITFGGSSLTNVACNGDSTGTITVVPAGGSGTYTTFAWNPNVSTTANASNLWAGSFSVTVTDNTGCTNDTTFTITEPAAGITFGGSSQTNVSCQGDSTGTITVVPTGGSGTYTTFTWNPNVSTTANASNLWAGSFSVTVTDNAGCSNDTTFTITEPSNGITFGGSSQTNINCQGDSTGTITVVPAGGSGTYTSFAWNPNVSTTANASNLWAGNFTVTVTDNAGCSNDTTFTITEPATGITFGGSSQTNVTCNGDSTGTITVVPAGGSGTYTTFVWNPNVSTTANASNLWAGNFSVTVTDNAGCSNDTTFTITEPANGITFGGSSQTNVACNGDSTGTITVVPSGGSGTFTTFTWNPNVSTTANASNLWAGNFSVTVTDNAGCSNDTTFTITEPANGITFGGSSQTNNLCRGDSNGTITVVPSGGSGTFTTFVWNPNVSTTANASNLWAGNFSVTVTDNAGCSNDTTFTITEPATGITAVTATTPLNCFGDVNGTASVTSTGGTSPYTYTWSTGTAGATDSLRVNMPGGTFTVTVSDAGGCSIVKTDSITSPDSLSASFTQITQPGCGGGGVGSVTVTPTGGTPNYTYTWIGGGVTGSTDSIRNNIPPGTIQVVVSDARGCSADTLSQVLGGAGTINPVFTQIQNPLCAGDSTGALTITPTGGTQPFTFNWNMGIAGSSDSIRTNLPGGVSVQCIVSDGAGCSDTASITLTNPVTVTLTFTDSVLPLCAGDTNGSITVTPLGGTKPYSYAWSNGDADSVANNLGGGIMYRVTVTDNLGCTAIDSAQVSDPAPITASMTDSTVVQCNGSTNGSLTVTPSGGSPLYGYSWSASNGSPVSTSPTSDSIAINLAGNLTYTVTVTDGFGCTATAIQALSEPDTITAIIRSFAGRCGFANGRINVPQIFIQGGTGPYTVTYDSNGTTIGTGFNITGLWPGFYGVTITDSRGCTQFFSVEVSNLFSPVVVLDSLVDAFCPGVCSGSIATNTLTPFGPHTYLWSNGDTTEDITKLCAGTYSLTVTDTNSCTRIVSFDISNDDTLKTNTVVTPMTCNGTGCDGIVATTPTSGFSPYSYVWSTSATDTLSSITNRCAGTYSVTVTDDKGCVVADTATIDPRGNITITSSADSVSCFGGSDGQAQVTAVTGGTSPYSYLWSTGASDTFAIKTGLSAGTYFVTVTELGGCSAVDTVIVEQPTGMSAVFNNVEANCGQSDGVANVTVSGSQMPYTYNWPVGGIKASSTDSNYAAGAYNVIVSDNKGCSQTFPFNINNINGPTVTVDSVRDESCVGACDGGIFISVSGGTPTYTYSWSPGTDTTQDISGKCPNTYDVRVTDQNNCVTISSNTINAATAINPGLIVVNHATGFGVCDGRAQSVPTGGTSPYTYVWSSGSSSDTANGLCAGFHTVTVTDAKGCTSIDSIEITEPNTLTLDSVQTTDATCQKIPCDGKVKIFVSGGSGTYTYLWDNGDTADSTINRCAGNLFVTVTDGSIIDTFLIPLSETKSSTINALLVQDVSCNGGSDGIAAVTLVSGQPLTSFIWSPSGGTSDTAKSLSAGSYTVTATNVDGCDAVDTVSIGQPAVLGGTTDTISPNCGASDGSIIAQVSGGNTPYSITWLDASLNALVPPQTGDTARNLSSGIYHYRVTDNKGCSATVQATLVDKNAPSIVVDSIRDVSCFGKCDGGIFITATGGSGTLSYLWTPGGKTTPDLDSACAGTYSVQVTDGLGCSANLIDTIKAADSLSVNVTKLSDASAVGACDGSASVSVTGGTPTYTYSWTGGGNTSLVNNLCGGVNYVTVTDSKGCSGIDSVEILEPITIVLIQVDTTQPACGVCDGKIRIVPGGGTAPYTFLWDNGDTADSTINRCAGVISVTVTDAALVSQSFNIGLNNINGPTITLTSTDISCFGACDGTANAIASAGTSPYTYTWPTLGITDSSVSNLCRGTYLVEVRDAKGCITTDSATIQEPSQILVNVSTTIADCGQSNGTASAAVVGGVPPYAYTWSSTSATTPSISGLAAGAYTVTVQDTTGCSEVTNFNISNPTGPTVVIDTLVKETCNGSCDGGIFITASGTVAPYTFLWTPGGMATEDISNQCSGIYTVEVTDSNNCVTVLTDTITGPAAPGQTITVVNNASAFGVCNGKAFVSVPGGNTGYNFQWSSSEVGDTASLLCAGVNYVTITTPAGCQFIDSVVITQPQKMIIINQVVVEPNCNVCDGKITVTIAGGTPPYSYLWDNGDTTDSTTNRCAGVLFLTVTDVNSYSEIFQINLNNKIAPNVTYTKSDLMCANVCDGAIKVVGSGTVAPYSYNWPTLSSQSDSVDGLCAGSYNVEVTDKVGCMKVETIDIISPDPILVSFSLQLAKCGSSDGIIFSSTTGGTPKSGGYDYLWLDNNKVAIVPNQTSANLLNIVAGLYHLEVTDSNSCVDTASVTLNNIGGLSISLDSIKNATCSNSCDGEITVSTNNSLATYLWFPNGDTTTTVNGLCAGSYTVEATDTSGCKSLNTFNITAPDAFNVSARKVVDATCVNTNDGSIETTLNEVGIFTYAWTGPNGFTANTSSISNLLNGEYNLAVSNSKGCVDSLTQAVGVDVFFNVEAGRDSTYCGEQSTPIFVQTTNAGLYTTTWYSTTGFVLGTKDTIIVNHETGRNRYVVEIREDVCVLYDTVVVFIEDQFVIDAGKDRTIISGQKTTLGGDPTAPTGRAIIWNPPTDLNDDAAQNPVATPEETTTYIVSTAGIEGGCISKDTVIVKVEDRVAVNDAFSPNGDGVNDVWVINVLEDYPDAHVKIFNRWGQVLYDEYPYVPWDGTYQGEDVQLGTYYYIIDLRDNEIENPILTGPITIIR